MSDPMMGAPGGMPGTEEVMRQNRSIFNPTDMAMASQEGTMDMSIREFFGQHGIDVEGPMTQMIQFVQDQATKADPMQKMQAIAGSQPPADPLAGMTGGGQPAPGGAAPDPLEQLMR